MWRVVAEFIWTSWHLSASVRVQVHRRCRRQCGYCVSNNRPVVTYSLDTFPFFTPLCNRALITDTLMFLARREEANVWYKKCFCFRFVCLFIWNRKQQAGSSLPPRTYPTNRKVKGPEERTDGSARAGKKICFPSFYLHKERKEKEA